MPFQVREHYTIRVFKTCSAYTDRPLQYLFNAHNRFLVKVDEQHVTSRPPSLLARPNVASVSFALTRSTVNSNLHFECCVALRPLYRSYMIEHITLREAQTSDIICSECTRVYLCMSIRRVYVYVFDFINKTSRKHIISYHHFREINLHVLHLHLPSNPVSVPLYSLPTPSLQPRLCPSLLFTYTFPPTPSLSLSTLYLHLPSNPVSVPLYSLPTPSLQPRLCPSLLFTYTFPPTPSLSLSTLYLHLPSNPVSIPLYSLPTPSLQSLLYPSPLFSHVVTKPMHPTEASAIHVIETVIDIVNLI